MTKKFLIILTSLNLISCKDKKYTYYSIEVTYLSFSVTNSSPADCGTLEAYKFTDEITDKKHFADTTITSKKIYDKIISRIKNLKPNPHPENYFEVRIKAYINYPNENKIDTICLSHFNDVILNNQIMENDSLLSSMVKEASGYYKHVKAIRNGK